jgi:RES domain-containing protein
VRLARIGSTGPSWRPEDMSGTGASLQPGRWNRLGERVVYAAPSLALAVLETAAHIDDTGLPQTKYVVEIDVPDPVWDARLTVAAPPVGWDAIPHGVVSLDVGSAWHAAGRHAVLEVPSVIVPEEFVVLINATHPDSALIAAKAVRKFQYNALFRHL